MFTHTRTHTAARVKPGDPPSLPTWVPAGGSCGNRARVVGLFGRYLSMTAQVDPPLTGDSFFPPSSSSPFLLLFFPFINPVSALLCSDKASPTLLYLPLFPFFLLGLPSIDQLQAQPLDTPTLLHRCLIIGWPQCHIITISSSITTITLERAE